MNERGAALVEALIVALTAAVIGAAAMRVIADLPGQAAKWEEASAARQRMRTIEARIARIAAGAGPIELEVDGSPVRIPSIWPRRLGLFRPGAAREVSSVDVTLLSRVDGHRALLLASALGAEGAPVTVTALAGCGTAAMCGLGTGDLVLSVARDGACGLFRVEAAAARLDLAAIMTPGSPAFEPGSVLIPIVVDVISFDRGEGTLRRYDGYRSDNVMVEGLQTAAFTPAAVMPLSLGDGPFIGAGALGYNADQLQIAGIRMRLTLIETTLAAFAPGASLEWRIRAWP